MTIFRASEKIMCAVKFKNGQFIPPNCPKWAIFSLFFTL